MSIIEYTARRSFYSDHVAGTRYEIEVEIAIDSLQLNVEEVKFIERSPGGGMEQGLERIDVFVPLRIILASGETLMQLREFLDSTESGETFRVYVCDEADSPRGTPYIIKRLDDGHTEIPFIRLGTRQDDSFAVNITGLVSSVDDADSDGSNVYDGGGGGGLNPPEVPEEPVTLLDHEMLHTGEPGSGSQEPRMLISVNTTEIAFGAIHIGLFGGNTLTIDGGSYDGSGEWWTGGGAAPTGDYEIMVSYNVTSMTDGFTFILGDYDTWADLDGATPQWTFGAFFNNSAGNITIDVTVTIRRKSDEVEMAQALYSIEFDCI